jgi:hypothetical protein
MSDRARLPSLLLVVLAAAACPGDDGGAEPVFPADYAATYQEVRDCRQSTEHDFRYIRVLADPAALGPYTGRDAPFPPGAVVLKEEFGFADPDCAGPIVELTAMRKNPDAPDGALGWDWQRVDDDRKVVEEGAMFCAGCHATCAGVEGFDGTCTEP